MEEKVGIEELLKGPVTVDGPKGPRTWDFSQKRGEVIPFPKKPKRGIEELIENEEIFVGKAPKTKKSTLDAKKERDLLFRDADEDILRIKKENKDAIRRFKEKNPDKFYAGGIAPLVGEPSYAAHFYDDRTPYGWRITLVKGGRWFLNKLLKKKEPKVKKDRLATAAESEDYIEILDPTGETGVVHPGMTIRHLDDMVAEQSQSYG